MMHQITKWLACAALLASPLMLEAKSKCKRDFAIATHKTEVAVGYSKTKLSKDGALLIVLSDGSRWKVKARQAGAELQQMIESGWRAGDDIRIDDADNECPAEFLLKNARSGQVYMADLDGELEEGAAPVTISKIDKNGYALLTTDGRQWAIGWLGSFTSSRWKVGDTLLINKSHHSNSEDYALINMRDHEQVWASIVNW